MNAIQVSNLLALIILTVAAAILLYLGLRALLGLGRDLFTELRASFLREEPEEEEADELHPGPFNLRRSPSALRQRYLRRHRVNVRSHWNCQGKWTPRE